MTRPSEIASEDGDEDAMDDGAWVGEKLVFKGWCLNTGFVPDDSVCDGVFGPEGA